jgi:hypothetical protein
MRKTLMFVLGVLTIVALTIPAQAQSQKAAPKKRSCEQFCLSHVGARDVRYRNCMAQCQSRPR